MTKKFFGLLGLGAACVACCLPAIAAGIAALGAGGILTASIGGISLDVILCVWAPIVFASIAAAMMWIAYRKRAERSCGCESSCEV